MPERIVCSGAIVLRDERVLLICRGRAPSARTWSLPGGRVEASESEVDAAIRELEEETGLVATSATPLEVVEVEAEGVLYEIHECLCYVPGREGPRAATDATDARFVTLEEARVLGATPLVLAVVERAMSMR